MTIINNYTSCGDHGIPFFKYVANKILIIVGRKSVPDSKIHNCTTLLPKYLFYGTEQDLHDLNNF